MVQLGLEGLGDPAIDRVRVLKVHSQLPPDLPHSCFIVPSRDARDGLMSYMRFMRCGFDEALDYVRGAVETARHYAAFPRERTLFIAYEDIVVRPAAVVRTIARFLSAKVEDRALFGIVRSYSRENVGRMIAKKERELARRSRDGEAIRSDELVVLGSQRIRMFDTATGFQSGHVSRSREGDWQKFFTPHQRARLEAHLADLARVPGPGLPAEILWRRSGE
jgi:hypothetical protein